MLQTEPDASDCIYPERLASWECPGCEFVTAAHTQIDRTVLSHEIASWSLAPSIPDARAVPCAARKQDALAQSYIEFEKGPSVPLWIQFPDERAADRSLATPPASLRYMTNINELNGCLVP